MKMSAIYIYWNVYEYVHRKTKQLRVHQTANYSSKVAELWKHNFYKNIFFLNI